MSSEIRLRSEWLSLLESEFDQPYMSQLSAFLRAEKAAGKTIYPPGGQLFAALDATPPEAVKVVVLGQDPYHGPGQAHGLSFSVQGRQRIPPSLQNIFRELQTDIGMPVPSHGDLSQWAERGVLLLNSVLSVEHGAAGSHQGHGWERFTDAVVATVNEGRHPSFSCCGGLRPRKRVPLLIAPDIVSSLRRILLRCQHTGDSLVVAISVRPMLFSRRTSVSLSIGPCHRDNSS